MSVYPKISYDKKKLSKIKKSTEFLIQYNLYILEYLEINNT